MVNQSFCNVSYLSLRLHNILIACLISYVTKIIAKSERRISLMDSKTRVERESSFMYLILFIYLLSFMYFKGLSSDHEPEQTMCLKDFC